MFGLSVEHLLILLVAALFILGPEQLRAELGPEFHQLRKPLQDLQALR
jgi:sec-independent protein translocase protein TatB